MKQLLLFVMTLLPMVSSADKSGKCGTNVYYSYNESTQKLTIYGEGPMYNYKDIDDYGYPWRECSIKYLEIENGVTSVGDLNFPYKGMISMSFPNSVTSIGVYAFLGCGDLTSITLPNSVTKIGKSAFLSCDNLATIVSEIENPFSIDNSVFSSVLSKAKLIVPKGTIDKYKATDGWKGFANIVEATENEEGDITDNGIYYDLMSDGTLEVAGLSTSTTIADIPSSIIVNGTKYRVTSIGARAFEGRSDITYLSIPYSIKSIGEYAFMGCGSNMTVNIADPESWCQMQLGNEHASPLSSASKVLVYDVETTSIDIPETVTSINAFTFYQCSCITSVNIPSSVTSIGSSAFEDCDYLTSLTLSDGLQSIGGSAFEGCKRLPSVTIPSTVTSIAINAFKNCSGLLSVTSEIESPFTIDNSVFYGIPSNAKLMVPQGTEAAYKKAGWDVFSKISEATVTYREYIYEVGENNNWGIEEQPLYCANLDGVYKGFFYAQAADWSNGMGVFKFTGAFNNWDNGNYGAGVYTDKGGTIIDDNSSGNLLATPGFYYAEVNLIDMTYKLTPLTSIGIIGPVQSGGWDKDTDLTYNPKTRAWEATVYLTADEFKLRANDAWDFNWGGSFDNMTQDSDNLKIAEAGTYFIQFFPLCETKSYMTISNVSEKSKNRTVHVETAGTLSEYISDAEKIFIEELTITGELNGTDIAFIRRMAGAPVNYYQGSIYTEMEKDYEFGNLTVLDISGASIVSGGDYYCKFWIGLDPDDAKLDDEYSTSNNTISEDMFRDCKFTKVSLPNNIMKIESDAFRNCESLTSIDIPQSVTSIGSGAFAYCNLTSIEVESGNNKYDSRNNCNAIIEKSTNTLIVGCKNTIIPNSVTSIGSSAFYGCISLTSVTIPNSVNSIGDGAFSSCKRLSSVTIGNSVTSISDWAFSGCSGLTSVTIPNSVTSIGSSAFNGCSGLTSVTIPNSVTSIGDYAFDGCSGLTTLTIGNSVTSIGKDAFKGTGWYNNQPDGLVYAGKVAYKYKREKMSANTISITLKDGTQGIAGNAFSGCSDLVSITIPNSVTSIGSYAFYNCSGLSTIISEIRNPFEISESLFYSYDKNVYDTATLIVPKGSKTKYQKTVGWSNFTNIKEILDGDVNLDGKVNDADVKDVASYIMGMTPNGFNKNAADVNNDNKVNAADLVLINNIIKSK